MLNGSNCDRKSQLSQILTEPLNPRDIDLHLLHDSPDYFESSTNTRWWYIPCLDNFNGGIKHYPQI